MNEPQIANLTSPGAAAEARNASLVYILYLVSFVVGITCLVGVVMAYVNKGSAPEWLQSHYRYQIRTFWIGLLYGAVGAITTLAFVGFGVLAFLAVWFIIRCVMGLKNVQAGEPVAKPATWLW
jgi:uncharacterized membrane protein